MRSIKNVIEMIASEGNVRRAIRESLRRRNKDNELHRNAERFLKDEERNVKRICHIIRTGGWKIFGYRRFVRVEHEKERIIDWNPSFEDNVVQHAVYQVLGERLIRTFIPDTYSGIKGRGGAYGMKRLKKFLFQYSFESPLYVLKLDIHHFYPSIDIGILKAMLARKVKDSGALALLNELIDSHPDGLPIGNFLSQMLANFYLSEFDHWVVERLGFHHYMRYCDDIVILSDNKESLRYALREIRARLAEIHLEVKSNVQVFPIERYGIDFMGYVFRRSEVLLRKRIERSFRRSVKRFLQSPSKHTFQSLVSYFGWTSHLSRGDIFWNKTVGRTLEECAGEVPKC